jgi:hypothetical protein
MTLKGYDVQFRWQGDIREEQERMIAWLKDHGEEIVAGFCTDGTGGVSLYNIDHVCALAHDCHVAITSVQYYEEEYEEEPVAA